MKVAFDISMLGLGHHLPAARTGIYRTVETIAYGLVASPECAVSFCATQHWKYVPGYLQGNQVFSKYRYLKTPASMQLADSMGTLLLSISNRIQNGEESVIQKLPLKIARQILHRVLTVGAADTNPLDLQALCKMDIVHFTYSKVPTQVMREKRVVRFHTVYDLIPILHGKEFGFENHFLKGVIDELGQDDWIICISEATKNDLCNYTKKIDPDKVLVIYLAASELFYPCTDPEKVREVRQRYGVPDAPYFLSLCTLERRKNLETIIRSFSQLVESQQIDDLNLVLVGGSKENYKETVLKAFFDNPRLQNRVILPGYVADPDLAPLYSGSLGFIYPSLYEGFGLPPLEAMQCGVPVITSNTTSLPEVVGDAGFMVSPTDIEAMCHAMLKLYSDSRLWSELSAKAQARAKLFSWKRCTDETIAAYKKSLA